MSCPSLCPPGLRQEGGGGRWAPALPHCCSGGDFSAVTLPCQTHPGKWDPSGPPAFARRPHRTQAHILRQRWLLRPGSRVPDYATPTLPLPMWILPICRHQRPGCPAAERPFPLAPGAYVSEGGSPWGGRLPVETLLGPGRSSRTASPGRTRPPHLPMARPAWLGKNHSLPLA